MTDSVEQKGNKSIKKDEKLSPEELAASLVDFVKMKVEQLEYPRFFSAFKLPEKRVLIASSDRTVTPLITSDIKVDLPVQKESPSYRVNGKNVKDAQTQIDQFVYGMADMVYKPEEYGFCSALPIGAVFEEIPVVDRKTKKIVKTKQTQTATEAYLNKFISDF